MENKEIHNSINEGYWERLELVMERLEEIREEHAESIDSSYQDYFVQMADLLLALYSVTHAAVAGKLSAMSKEEGIRLNRRLFLDVQEPDYEDSYANPAYAVSVLGEEYGALLCAVDARLHGIYPYCMEGDIRFLCIYAELFVELFNCFENPEELNGKELQHILYSFMHDYTEIFNEEAVTKLLDPEGDRAVDIVMEADLSEPSYLYRYGLCVGEDERKTAAFLQKLPQQEVQSMADAFTEGYRIGFAANGKDISLKSVVEIRYPMGFERMIRAAVFNFDKMGLKPVLKPFSVTLNRQYVYDHKEDDALWLDKAFVERSLEVDRLVWEKQKRQAPLYGGPAVIDVFGQEPFAPQQKKERIRYSQKQQKLSVHLRSEKSSLINRYIHGEERSFTIIAFPLPSIGEKFADIFEETLRINTLDYTLYRDMQQKIIEVLDTADRVHITGKNGNSTDLYVKIYPLADPGKETAFENCVADVNIPVGEVFTTPVLKGTTGTLFVSQVYLNDLRFENLKMEFSDGKVVRYTCTNFESEEENRRYIEDNVLFHHKTLPMGEFAIGTNTMAYRMARKYEIADKLPILIAEKTGPHFAVGDTCYTYDEDHMTYNPDGRAIVARDNEISLLRKTDVSAAYFNCHTDITIPYDELDRITVIRKDGTTEDIIANGRFVVLGTELLNEPLDAQ